MTNLLNIAIAGATGTIGKEVLGMFAERNFPSSQIIALASSNSIGQEISYGEEKILKIQGLENFDFQQGKLNEQMQKLQEQLGKMKFNFDGLDSLDFKFDGFAFPDIKDMQIHPNIKFFDFEGDGPGEFHFEKRFPDGVEDGHEGIYGLEKHDSKNFSEALGNALNRDGLLIPGQENKVELTGKHLKINGEKQPGNIYQKYKRIFEEQSGTTLQKNSKLEFNFTGKESKRKYRVY